MNTCLYVGSIPYNTREPNLIEFFEQAGEVVYARIIRHNDTKLSKGFGFIEMANEEETKAALNLNGTEFGESKIIVKEALGNKNHKDKYSEDVKA